jgi:hypothetical protein
MIYFNYNKPSYFASICLEPYKKNLKEIKEKESDKLEKKFQEKKTLKQDSCLGYIFSLSKIDLSRFIRNKYFILLYIVSKNRYRIIFIIFTNSRANSFVFINTAYIIDITKFLNLKT